MATARFFAKQLLLTAIGLAVILAAAPSFAEVATPCSGTISKFCKDVIPGGGRIMNCLNDHRDDQSIACKDWVDDQMKSLNELMAVCPEEIAMFCGSEPPDRTRIYFCLLNNYISLRVECRSKLGEVRDRLK
jgi:Cysteine rich repeat